MQETLRQQLKELSPEWQEFIDLLNALQSPKQDKESLSYRNHEGAVDLSQLPEEDTHLLENLTQTVAKLLPDLQTLQSPLPRSRAKRGKERQLRLLQANFLHEFPQAWKEILEAIIQRLQQTPSNKPTKTSRKNPRLPRISDVFENGPARTPNNPLIITALESIWKGGTQAQKLLGGWQETHSKRPVYEHRGNKGGRILIYPSPIQDATSPLPTTKELWDFVGGLNPFTSDVALAVLAQLCEPTHGDKPKYPLLECVTITADAILDYKGIRRWGQERKQLWKRVMEEMQRLQRLQVHVERYPAHDPNTREWSAQGFSWKNDRLFDIVEVEKYRETLFGEKEDIEVVWSVRAGQWAKYWLNQQGRVYIARLARALLELDHRSIRGSELMAKKIGQSMMFLIGSVRELRPLRVDTLLERIGELPTPENRGKNWASRTRTRFNEALLTLRSAGMFTTVEWIGGYGPEQEQLPRGWVDKWLASKVRIEMPQIQSTLETKPPSQTLLPPITRQQTPKPKKEFPEIPKGQTLRDKRKQLGWTQQKLADYLSISKSYVSQMEKGKRVPSKKVQDNLRRWFHEHGQDLFPNR